jgi:hypothetical protein
MPQLDKFTYFTQFFWLCLFFFTFYIFLRYLVKRTGSIVDVPAGKAMLGRRRRVYSMVKAILFILLLVLIYFISMKIGAPHFLKSAVAKAAFSLGGRAVSFFGVRSGLFVALVFLIQLLLFLTLEGTPLLKEMNSSGSEGWTAYFRGSSTSAGGGSQNAPPAEPVPPGDWLSSSEEAASPARPDPSYQEDEVIGGDSIVSIQRRLLSKSTFPSSREIEWTRIRAEDLFEVKVEIIRRMTSLDPAGDWSGRGARALDSPNSATGESSLERLYKLLDDLDRGGKRSKAFFSLSEKVALRKESLDAHSAT